MNNPPGKHFLIIELPYITPGLSGIGGEIKSLPEHFVVEEIPLYEPLGEGEHIYITLTREGWTTRGLQKSLAQLFGLKEWGVGYAGLKDKQARVTQTFSLHLPKENVSMIKQIICDHLPVEIHRVERHRNKLRTGHLQGNRFRIFLQRPDENAYEQALAIAKELAIRGLPNFYGVQRFGAAGDNALHGLEILEDRGPKQRWKKRFLIDALRSALFNIWLTERIKGKWFETLRIGDIACKTVSGGLFEVTNLPAEMERFQKGEIAYTGPIYGAGMMWATGDTGEVEQKVLADAGVTDAMLRAARIDGTRRIARILVDDLLIEAQTDGLWFSFTLPPGVYATTVLREFMK